MEVDLDNETVRCNVVARDNLLRCGKDLSSLQKRLQLVAIICNSDIVFPSPIHQGMVESGVPHALTTH